MSLLVCCPAKVNLFLSVGPKDKRGYHPIRTIFQAVDLCDNLYIEEADRDGFECDWPLPEPNTVTKAWGLLKEFAHLPPLRVRLEKRIPAESGLGGGSSDAAGFLRSINGFLAHPLPAESLFEIACAVGADVPFFLAGGAALGEGYGEKLTPLAARPERWFVLAKPDIGCSTAEMYARLDALGSRPFLGFPSDARTNVKAFGNDFELVAPAECLALISFLNACQCSSAGLTGSGSAVFGVFPSRKAADEARQAIPAPWSFVAAVK